MKIIFTGGGTGGHFYPIIAVAQEVRDIIYDQKLIEPKLYYISDKPYNSKALKENYLEFIKIPTGKKRRYRSILNILDIFKTGLGLILALWKIFWIYPDVIFSKGGYASFPTVWAGRILKIPVIIHESDSKPGLVNKWAGKFATRVALSYPEAKQYFKPEITAVTGNPIRREIKRLIKKGSHEFLKLNSDKPTIFVVGGSQGAQTINEIIISILPKLLEKYQVIHQTGVNNYEEVTNRTSVILSDEQKKNYRPYGYLNDLAMRMAAGASDLIISRAGSAIFEIANWGLPSIIIPIPENISHDQRSNAFIYAHQGACSVIEENNLTPSILTAEINRIILNKDLRQKMSDQAKKFSHENAAKIIANEIINITLKHEK
ncbi:MAG: undecaprenyldiphospho-muramoylpentapeptide beta-N-acetylglucosaminyltransferase [Patescibacteria group bacterium]